MATAVLEDTAAERVDPIILEDAGDHVAQEIWGWLCKDRPETWLDDIAPLGKGKSSFEEMAAAWDTALETASRDPARFQTATQLRAKLRAHVAEVAEHRTRYRFVSPEVGRHRYWPTGKRENMERENLYTMSYCPNKRPLINRRTRITAAGNCFAMSMGKCLREWGYNYLIKEPGPPDMTAEERWRRKYGHYSVRQGILFNVPSIRQWAERGLGLIRLSPYLWHQDGHWLDPYREEVPFDSPEEYAKDLPVFERGLAETLRETDVLILSPSCTEVWRFKHDGSYLSRVPWKMSPALLERQVLSVEDNVRELQRLRDVLTRHKPDIQIIMTVSPVPLLATFRSEEMNVVVANSLDKAVLRVAAETFAARNENVTYFPGYEAVMFGSREPFGEDGRHVHPQAIERTMRMFRETYCVE